MGKLVLYGIDGSAPVRSVLLTLKALKVPFEYKIVNLFAQEHLKPEFLKINPQHTVPTLDDNGFVLWDSHAINTYLVDKYGSSDTLYPRDLQKRAVVDQRLHFDSSKATSALTTITIPIFRLNQTIVPKENLEKAVELYNNLESFLKNHNYIAGNELTIADFHTIALISTLEHFLKVDGEKLPKLASWLQRIKQLPYYEEANGKPLEQLVGFVKSKNITIE